LIGVLAVPQTHTALVAYFNSVMEPWEGPAASWGSAGNWVVAFTDRNGLRPLRYSITADGLLVAGSETGMVKLAEDRISRKGRLGPGQMIAVDLGAGRFYDHREIMDTLADSSEFGHWVQNITVIDDLVKKTRGERAHFEKDMLRRRQVAAGLSMEDLELVLQPMVEEAKEAVVSMGDDTPLAILSDQYRGLHHFF